ncbi:hypothetical protein NUU61_009700 [Penicillium alfredii]|uniref:Methyltransferase domain-containing protein n=1 Tax=Penicillium alfredii TaxID=1506179 RepID=A0A9W9JTX0_9EURO|nr:uncharacterized protein NUU61_009700 [Penicillium alfredii]KAJ5081436.1 hypothetical protein NUU61_009700 [Penicillium alfredii]
MTRYRGPPTFRIRTFSAYTKDQGATYVQARSAYHSNLFKRIVDHHVSTGGQLGTLVDVGCGPGTAIRTLAPRFDYAIGLDASEGMIATARQLGGTSANNQPIRFESSSAEDLGADTNMIPNGTVDLIIAATAAHWFDMSRFWPRAAELLRPGGTQAINLDTLEAVIRAASPVTRWRQAHPDQAGTEKDVVKMIRGQIARLLYEAGVLPGEERVKVRVTERLVDGEAG